MKDVVSNNFIESEIIEDINTLGLEQIITRFPPEPNGHGHIGHAKAICVDFLTAKKFGGKTNLRMDDTNPAKESMEYARGLMRDVRWLGFKWNKLTYASSYYGKIYECAVDLIKQGKAYVCDLNGEQISAGRGTLTTAGTNSPYRDRSIEENLELFEKMKAGEFADGEKVLRAKIDMASPNMNMRDPVIYRILRANHYRTKNKWLIYPMYDFAHPLGDAIEKVTHSLCTAEFEDHRPLYNWVIDNVSIIDAKPRQIEFARLDIDGTVLSKRYLQKLVADNIVDGWDDPRMPTISGMRRKGVPPEAIVDFVQKVGVSKSNSLVAPHIFDACVRENLNKNAMRVMAIIDPIKLVVTNYQDDVLEKINISNNPTIKNSKKHSCVFSKNLYIEREDFNENPPPKYFRLTVGGIVRLMGGYIVRCDKVVKIGDKIDHLECSVVTDATLKPKATIHWVSEQGSVEMVSRRFGGLIKAGESYDAERLAEILNPNSVTEKKGRIEKFALKLKKNVRMQFVRNGYYYLDKTATKYTLIYNEIVGLKDSK